MDYNAIQDTHKGKLVAQCVSRYVLDFKVHEIPESNSINHKRILGFGSFTSGTPGTLDFPMLTSMCVKVLL